MTAYTYTVGGGGHTISQRIEVQFTQETPAQQCMRLSNGLAGGAQVLGEMGRDGEVMQIIAEAADALAECAAFWRAIHALAGGTS